MARGNIAKTNVIDTIAKAFGSNYIGEYDKKIYVTADDGGEPVQIAIALTCPKNPVVAIPKTQDGGINFDAPPIVATTGFAPAEFTDKERENIQNLIESLNL